MDCPRIEPGQTVLTVAILKYVFSVFLGDLLREILGRDLISITY